MADNLPVEVLELIFRNLTDLSDIYTCRSVCSQWHRAVATIISSIPTPLLYLAPPTSQIEEYDQEHPHDCAILATWYCNKSRYTTYNIIFPDSLTKSNNAYTTHKGWFIFSDDVRNVFLYGPLSREIIKLPQFLDERDSLDKVHFVTSSAPTKPDCIILVYYLSIDGFFRFEFCTPGDENWTPVSVSDDIKTRRVHDMIYYNGEFYAVNWRGFLLRFDLSVQCPHIVSMSTKINNFSEGRLYLMESPSKELIMVTREGFLTDSIAVFKLDWGRCNWEKMMKFGDRESIFLAHYDSIFIKTDDYRSNCIYFFDDWWGGLNSRLHDFGFYDMKSRAIKNVNMNSSKFLNASFYRWFKG